ncbi:MAG: hypothetical protein EGQ30_06080 [Clostridiales bacterium]|nr:hypothetical protein [Clostridiales bacterium]
MSKFYTLIKRAVLWLFDFAPYFSLKRKVGKRNFNYRFLHRYFIACIYGHYDPTHRLYRYAGTKARPIKSKNLFI